MTYELLFFILFVATEIFELLWQKSPTLHVMLEKIYGYYKKSPYLLYAMHPSYILGLCLFYLTSFNLWILLILAIKSLDIIFKVMLINRLFVFHNLSKEIKMMLSQPLHPFMLSMGLMLYPYLLFLAIF